MTLNLKLGDREELDPLDDGMERRWKGYDPGLSDDALFAQNCGVWVLGTRATRERFATFSHDGEVVFVVELSGIDDISIPATGAAKKILRGRVLPVGDPVRGELMGTPINSFRNPVSYIDDPPSSPRLCACGCRKRVSGGRLFVPGHDQRAVHERIARRWGSAIDFMTWFDATEDDGSPSATADDPAA